MSPPEVYQQTSNWQDVRRFTGSASIKYDPVSWLVEPIPLIGTDYTLEDVNSLLPFQTDSVIVFFLGLAVRRTALGDDAADDVQHVRLRVDGEVQHVEERRGEVHTGHSVLHEHAVDAHREWPALPIARRLDDHGDGIEGRADVGAPRKTTR